jgi:wyosine [tRNA(Phe)-imidazoG37] synthetase (radical SAM superfamily)
MQSLEDALKFLFIKPTYITFSGNGEPTLHPNFIELVEGVIKLRDKYSPNSKTAILSNATTVDERNIRKSLLKLDAKILKFECGHEDTFKRYNRPCCDITLEKIFLGLKEIPGIIVQSLFTDGQMGNYCSENIIKWIDKIVQLAPESVQLYTLDRGYPSDKISPLESQKLYEIKDNLVERNITTEVFV